MPFATVVQIKREDTTVERDMHHEGCAERVSRREYYGGAEGRDDLSSSSGKMGESRGVVDVIQSSAPSTMSYARGTLPDDIYTTGESQAQKNDDMEVSPLTLTSCHEPPLSCHEPPLPIAPPPLDVSLKPSSLVLERWLVSESKPAPQVIAVHEVKQHFAVNNSELQRDKDIDDRVKMTKQIEQILRQKKPHASQEWLVKLPQTAKRLDEILFSAAPSLAVYRDYSTLEQRLRQLALNKIKAQRMEEAQMLRIRLQQAHNRKVPSRVVDHTYHDYSNYPVQDPVVKMSFPKKLHEILSNPEFEHIISWMPHGRAWKLHSRDLFQTEVAPKYFHQEKFASFSRQLTGWGFKRLTKQGPDFNSYYHQCFLRDRPDLVVLLKRVPNNLGRLTPDANNEPNFYALHPAWFKKREDDSMRSDLSKKESSVSVSVPYKSNMHATSLDDAAATALISLSSVPNKSLLSHELKVSSKRPVLPLRNRREQLAQYLIQHQDHSQQNQYKHELLLPQKQVTKAVAAKLQSMVPKVANGPKAKTPTAMLPKVMKARGKYKVKLPKVMRTTGKHSDTETERSGRWTEVEHNAFLEGLEMYGKKWKKVSRHIKTRSVIQTRTHAQKYYLKLYKDGLHDDHVENVTDKKSTENELLATCTGKEHEMRPHTVPNKPMSQPIEKLPDKPQNNSPNVRAQVPDNYYYYHKYLRKEGDDIEYPMAHQPDAKVQELVSLPPDKEHDVHSRASETTIEVLGRMLDKKSQTMVPKVVKNGKWSATEHAAFLSGYAMYGKDWNKISAWVKTRTAVQTRMHGQSYFKLLREGVKDDEYSSLRYHAPEIHHPEAGVEEQDCRKKPPRILAGPMLQSSLPRSNSSDAISCLLKMSSDVTIRRMIMASTSTIESSSQNESSATSHQYPKSCHDSTRVFKATTEHTERLTKRVHEQPGTESPEVKNLSDKHLDTYNDSTYVGKWTAEEHAAFLSGLSMYGEDWSKVAGWVKTRSVIQTMAHAENYFQSLPKEAPISTHTGEWSTIENEAFVRGLELYGRDWVRIAAMIKTRTVVQTTAHAQNYFQQLMKEVNEDPVIARTSQPPVISRPSPPNVIARASPPNVITRTSQWIEDTNENSGRWNKTEQEAFLSGLELYGKNWRQVAAHVKTRTVIQTRTHAQKYFAEKKKGIKGKAITG